MIVDIEKVVVRDRIRKDFGDIQELADDIMQNGLINPPVVNKEYELLAGERRLRACKSLGWSQIEVRMMDTRDAEHELNVEISENDVRKGFTKSERVDYMKRLLRIEQAKAKDRMAESGGNISTPTGKSRDITAEQFGISGKTMEKEMTIVENRDLLDPSDFADWDEGKLSTNKAFLKVKGRQKELEDENKRLREAISSQGVENAKLRHELENAPAKETVKEVVKEVRVEVVPDDYEESKKRLKSLESENRLLAKDREDAIEKYNKADEKLKDLERSINSPKEKALRDVEGRCIDLTTAINAFLANHGGKTIAKEEFSQLSKYEKQSLERATEKLRRWLDELLDEVEVTIA